MRLLIILILIAGLTFTAIAAATNKPRVTYTACEVKPGSAWAADCKRLGYGDVSCTAKTYPLYVLCGKVAER